LAEKYSRLKENCHVVIEMVFNHTFLFEVITLNELSFLDGLISHLRVGASEDNFGPYICYVNNSIGAGVPCEADVQGKFVRVKITCMVLTINVQGHSGILIAKTKPKESLFEQMLNC
jgi:hypothetical protein